MKLLYTPFSTLAKLLGKRIGRNTSGQVWNRLGYPDGPPSPTDGHHGLVEVAVTAAVEAAVLAAIGAAVDQLVARAFHSLFGAWPGAGKPAREEIGDGDGTPEPRAAPTATSASGPAPTATRAAPAAA